MTLYFYVTRILLWENKKKVVSIQTDFILSCESTVDLPYDYVTGRDISVLFYSYVINGIEYTDNMGRDPEAMADFYQKISDGALPTTSQINTYQYEAYFEQLLQKGDVLHIALGLGMTPSVKNAYKAAEYLKKKYPDRKLVILDSKCSSTGYGMLVDCAADLRDQGRTIEEIETWVLKNRNRLHHQFFSTDLTLYKRSGRVSGPTASIATILGICPMMHLNSKGCIIAYSKVRGVHKAITQTAKTVMEHIQDGLNYTGKLFINHSNCPDLARMMREALIPYLKDKARNAPIYEIGSIIASHCGPGTVAVFFFGDERGNEK